jgi:DNA transformation protein
MRKPDITMIDRVPNLGPKSQAMLADAGITSLEQLRALGAVKAFIKVKRCGAAPSLNLLWALEGAISDRPWQEVAKRDRLSLLLALESEEQGHAR